LVAGGPDPWWLGREDFTTLILVKNQPSGPNPSGLGDGELGPREASTEALPPSPTRERILEVLRARSEPTSLAELSAASGLHVNTVRGHLGELLDVGTVSRTRAPAIGRGRPAWLYVADGPDPAPGTEYAGLATALALGLERSSKSPSADAVQAGEAWGRTLAAQVPADTDAATRVVRVLERMGFAPRRSERGVVRLTRCPLLQAARAHPDVVCGVHLGIVQGVLAESRAASSSARLEPFAGPGACLLTLPDSTAGAR
jgi:predicted ArsR family transcriptional regulator